MTTKNLVELDCLIEDEIYTIEHRPTIAIDVDGTIRDFQTQVIAWLEVDHPDKLEKFKECVSKTYYSLDEAFGGDRDAVHKWIYVERVFELFARAGRLHRRVMDDLNIFSAAADAAGWDVIIASVQRDRSITSTLHWLTRWGCRIKQYQFFDSMQDKIDAGFDIYLDDCPLVLEQTAGEFYDRPSAIKVPYEFNDHIDCPTLDIANGEFDEIYKLLKIEKILKQE